MRARLDPADDTAYWALLAKAWRQPGDLIVIEHDIGIHAGVVPGFEACRRPWCAHPYPTGAVRIMALGCTRFTAELKAAEPDLLDVVGADGTGGLPARHWGRLDVRILDELHRRGYAQHKHAPDVAHYHRYD